MRQIETLIYFVSGAEAGRGCPLRVNMRIFQHLPHEFKSLTSSLSSLSDGRWHICEVQGRHRSDGGRGHRADGAPVANVVRGIQPAGDPSVGIKPPKL